jgi:hypothetical protein
MHTGAATPTFSLHGVPRGLGWDVGIKHTQTSPLPRVSWSFVASKVLSMPLGQIRKGVVPRHSNTLMTTIMVRKAIVSSSSNAGMNKKNHAIDCSYAAFFLAEAQMA